MADLNDQQAAQTIKITGSNSSGTETNYVNASSGGAAYTNLRNDAGTELIGRQLPTVALPTIAAQSPTYSASVNGLTVAASATDIFTITGSASKTIRVTDIRITGTRSTATFTPILLIRRSTANTGGTSTSRTAITHDTTNAAATATVLSYTANPTLGTTVGTLKTDFLAMPVAAPGNAQSTIFNYLRWGLTEEGSQPIVLRGTSQVLAINLNAATVAGSSFNISIQWTEE